MTIEEFKILIIKGIFSCLEQFIQKVRLLPQTALPWQLSYFSKLRCFSSASIFRTFQLLSCNQRSITKKFQRKAGFSDHLYLTCIACGKAALSGLFWLFKTTNPNFRLFLMQGTRPLRSSQVSIITETVSRLRPGEKFTHE